MATRERSVDGPRRRQASARGYLMCPPEHFTVEYAIKANEAEALHKALGSYLRAVKKEQ